MEIDNLNKKLIKADQEKTVFFRYASHELKSPIVAVKSAIDGVINICKGMDNPKPHNIMQRASRRASQMLDIINELLELSHSREFKPYTSSEEIDINAQIKDCINNEIDQANTRGIKIKFERENAGPLLVGRKIDFEKVFSNLISNAIRYNVENGKVIIHSEYDNNQLVIKISDTGIGIPKDDLLKIFSEFYRAENAKRHISFGTGLGLSLVKQIIENYNGKILADSEVGKGTTFTITLPVPVTVKDFQ
jgi:signal transduction histidine kinase